MEEPGSGLVKKQAEDEGLDKIFLDAGFEEKSRCSMCLGMNEDQLSAGESALVPLIEISKGDKGREEGRIWSHLQWRQWQQSLGVFKIIEINRSLWKSLLR